YSLVLRSFPTRRSSDLQKNRTFECFNRAYSNFVNCFTNCWVYFDSLRYLPNKETKDRRSYYWFHSCFANNTFFSSFRFAHSAGWYWKGTCCYCISGICIITHFKEYIYRYQRG